MYRSFYSRHLSLHILLFILLQYANAGVNRLHLRRGEDGNSLACGRNRGNQLQVDPPKPVGGITQDAPYSVSQSIIESSVICQNGILGRQGGVVLLVPGTGSTGNESWIPGPYTELLPYLYPGYDVCFVNLPDRSQGDAQVTSEYVAGNIAQLAKKSKTGKVTLIGHSQGNLNIQWSVNFWPSTRQYVSHYVSLAGDFRGTTTAKTFCKVWGSLDKMSGNCTQAFFQQESTSKFVTALNHFGHTALVPTTSIYTEYDDVIHPESGPNATSVLPNAENIKLQDPKVCGNLHIVDHYTMILDPGAFALTYAAMIKAPGTLLNDWKSIYCLEYVGKKGWGTIQMGVKNIFKGNIKAFIDADASTFVYDLAREETKLMPYVCASGSAPLEQCQ